jgi:hypothetical protein
MTTRAKHITCAARIVIASQTVAIVQFPGTGGNLGEPMP